MKTRIVKFYKDHEDEISVACIMLVMAEVGFIIGHTVAKNDNAVVALQSKIEENQVYVQVTQKNGRKTEFNRELEKVLANI